jgi:ERCC4-related helicase
MKPTDLVKMFKEMGCLRHQAEFAGAFFAPESARTHLLISAPGMGKSFAAGAIVYYALSTAQAGRILVLAPSMLVAQWREVILRSNPKASVLIIDRPRLRELEESRPVGEDFWPQNAVVIMSMDFAKRDDVAASVVQVPWDCAVVDEVQLVTAQSQRGRILLELVRRWPKMRLLLLRIGGMLAGSETDASSDLIHDAEVTVWSRDSVRDHEGRPLLPEVKIEWIVHHRRPDETAVLTRLQESLKSMTDSGNTQSRFVAVTLLQSASSSLFALEQRLRRLVQQRNEFVHGIATEADTESESGEDGTDESLLTAQDVQVRIQLEVAEIATPVLEMLEQVTTDSKCEALLQTFHSLGVKDGAERRVCVFTRFVDTASYLESALRDRYSQVRVLTGSTEFPERKRMVEDFVKNGGVLIATESTEAGLPEVAAVIFYDLPLNPAVLEQRMGEFVRVGRHGPIHVLAFTDESNALTIERLQKKVAEVKEPLGESEIEKALFPTESK